MKDSTLNAVATPEEQGQDPLTDLLRCVIHRYRFN